MAANANCDPPRPTARSPAASAPTGALTCSPLSARSSAPPNAAASTPIRLFAIRYRDRARSHRVEQLHFVHTPIIGGLTRGSPAHGLPLHLEAVGVVYKAVHNRVRVGGIADLVMPAIQRDLRGDDGRTAAVAVVDDFHQIAPLLGGQL